MTNPRSLMEFKGLLQARQRGVKIQAVVIGAMTIIFMVISVGYSSPWYKVSPTNMFACLVWMVMLAIRATDYRTLKREIELVGIIEHALIKNNVALLHVSRPENQET